MFQYEWSEMIKYLALHLNPSSGAPSSHFTRNPHSVLPESFAQVLAPQGQCQFTSSPRDSRTVHIGTCRFIGHSNPLPCAPRTFHTGTRRSTETSLASVRLPLESRTACSHDTTARIIEEPATIDSMVCSANTGNKVEGLRES